MLLSSMRFLFLASSWSASPRASIRGIPAVRAGLLSIAVGLILILGCGGSSDSGRVAVIVDNGALTVIAVSDCPPCDASSSDTAYGRFAFFSNVTRETAQSILALCGFQVSGGHAGVSGDSLQIAGCGNAGVEFAFPSNSFAAFALRSGYTGSFGAGIRIGDPLADVLARDPALVQVDPRTFVRDDGTRRVEANFDADLRLQELIVGRGFVR